MLGDVGVGAHVELAPVGVLAQAVPRLLAVDDEPVAVLDGPGPQRGQVGPASGSDIPWHQISSPRSIGVRNRSFCSGVPSVMMAGAMLATPITFTGPGACRSVITSW